MKRISYLISALILIFIISACARPREEKEEKKGSPKVDTREIKAVEYPVPENLSAALPGLLNDRIRIWKEISPTINLVAYFKDYSLKKAIESAASAFLILLEKPEFRDGIDFWIIQIQPEKGSEVLVWGVKPEEAEQYQKSKDLKSFFKDSEYVLVNDQIIPKGDERVKFLSEDAK